MENATLKNILHNNKGLPSSVHEIKFLGNGSFRNSRTTSHGISEGNLKVEKSKTNEQTNTFVGDSSDNGTKGMKTQLSDYNFEEQTFKKDIK